MMTIALLKSVSPFVSLPYALIYSPLSLFYLDLSQSKQRCDEKKERTSFILLPSSFLI
jgi:hypothetical protein